MAVGVPASKATAVRSSVAVEVLVGSVVSVIVCVAVGVALVVWVGVSVAVSVKVRVAVDVNAKAISVGVVLLAAFWVAKYRPSRPAARSKIITSNVNHSERG